MTVRDDVISSVVLSLSPDQVNDIPAIHQTLNDTMDDFMRSGLLTSARANSWSQDRMTKEVQREMKIYMQVVM